MSMTGGLAEMHAKIEALRGVLASAAREGVFGGEDGEIEERLLNVGFLLGSCMNVAPEGYSMVLFNRLHRLHGELVAMAAPVQMLEGLQRVYTAALELQIGSLKEPVSD